MVSRKTQFKEYDYDFYSLMSNDELVSNYLSASQLSKNNSMARDMRYTMRLIAAVCNDGGISVSELIDNRKAV